MTKVMSSSLYGSLEVIQCELLRCWDCRERNQYNLRSLKQVSIEPVKGGDANVKKQQSDLRLVTLRIMSRTPRIRVADVARAREQRSPKGQGLLRKEGPPTYAILSQNNSIVVIYTLFERLSQDFQRKPSCLRRAFNKSNPAFVDLSTKALLLS